MLDRFTLELPDGWINQTAYLIMGPVEGEQAPTVTLTLDREATVDTLDEFADMRVNMLEDAFAGMEILKNENITLANGLAAREFIAQMNFGDEPIYRKHIWLLESGVGYDFVGDFSRQTLKTFGLDMLRMAGTLQAGGE